MKDYIEEHITFTKQEIQQYCFATGDVNEEHNINLDRVLVPGLLVCAKAFGKVEQKTHLVEQSVRLSDKIYQDDFVVVRKMLLAQRKIPQGLFQKIKIDVFANNAVKYRGWIKILKYD